MSKRYTGEEWSDDDIDGSSLSGSPPKRRRNSQHFESKESSESGFFSRTINRIYSSVNNLFKGFNLSSDEQRMNCESVRSQSSLGMNQTNDFYSLDIRSEESILQNNQYIRLTPVPNQTNYVLIQQNPSPQSSVQMLTHVPIQLITANTSPNINSSIIKPIEQNHNQMNRKIIVSNNDSNEESLENRTAFPDYTMFGTYRTNAKTVEFNADGIKLTNVSANTLTIKFKHHVMIPFIEMQELFYCYGDDNTLLFIKPTLESNNKIQQCMYLGSNSTNGLRFDVKSEDSRENYIIAVLKEKMNEKYAKRLQKFAKYKNSDIKCDAIEADLAKHLLEAATTRSSQRVCVINNSNHSTLQTPPKRPFPYSKNRNTFKSSDTSDSSPSPLKSCSSSRRPHLKTPVQTIIIDIDDDDQTIIDTMFGTYQTNAKTIEFDAKGIKLTNVSANTKEIKFKYHIMIAFVEMQELFYYCEDDNLLLFIKPTLESNNKIQESMYLGSKSINGLRLDIKSEDSREHYIIAVLKEKMSEKFAELLQKLAKLKNSDIKCGPIEVDLAKHLFEAPLFQLFRKRILQQKC